MSTCPRCGASFTCCMADAAGGKEPCWCTQLPPLPQKVYRPDPGFDATGRCFCPACLHTLVAAQGAAPQD